MTPVFCCGFECGAIGPHVSALSGAPAPTFSTSTVRSGSRSLRINNTGGSSWAVMANQPTQSINVFRFYIYFTTLPNVDWTLTQNGGVATGVVLYFKAADSSIYSKISTNSSSSGIPVTTGKWYCVDVMIRSYQDPWTIDFKIDGIAAPQLSFSTANGSMVAVSSLGQSSGNTTADVFFDDYILSNTEADYPIGPGFILPHTPQSDGTHSISSGDFKRGTTATNITTLTTDAYTLIDDVPLPSGATTDDSVAEVVNTGGGAEYVEVNFGVVSGFRGSMLPRAVELVAVAHAASGNPCDIHVKLLDNGTVSTSVIDFSSPGTAFVYKTQQYPALFGGSGPWSKSRVDAIKARIGYGADCNPDAYVDAVMLEVEYAQASLIPPQSTPAWALVQ